MITKITRILLLIQVTLGIGLALLTIKFFHVSNPWLALLAGIGLIIWLRLLITANNFLLAWRYHSETPAAFRLHWRQICRLFLGEFMATMWSSSWTMPFQYFEKRIVPHPSALPVLLVHGYGCNSGYWNSMSKALLRANITHYAINMEPVLGTIDAYAAVVHEAMKTLCLETGQEKAVIVAHSMGGLAARAYLRDHGSEHIAKIITLGTPHHGTALANFSIGLNGQQMRWSRDAKSGVLNNWLAQLQKGESEAMRALFVSIYSHHDNIISPQTSSYLPGAKNIEFRGIGHVALALDPAIQSTVIEEIRAASQPYAAIAAPASHTLQGAPENLHDVDT
ncbi:MAG TPA: alpha/beta fold hydrolase [Burkholderiaceae bacterium]|nr:alpha/beta fold hydrolase [Burkholderiaceae bacterium]